MGRRASLTVKDGEAGERLDLFVSANLPELTRSAVKNLVVSGLVTVDGRAVKAGHKLKPGEAVEVELPEETPAEPGPEDIPIDILYEDDSVIVVDKPPGLAVHPGAGRTSGTLVNALLHHAPEMKDAGDPERPGIVHRLDKDTTGVLVAAKTPEAHRSLSAQFKAHSTGRTYSALVWGNVDDDSGVIDLPLGRDATHRKKISTRTRKARRAVTRFEVKRRYGQMTLLELTPETGRTHQLRVHLASTGHPVAGDPTYCRRRPPQTMDKAAADAVKGVKRQLLHARTLAFDHPEDGRRVEFSAPEPEDMRRVLEILEEKCS